MSAVAEKTLVTPEDLLECRTRRTSNSSMANSWRREGERPFELGRRGDLRG